VREGLLPLKCIEPLQPLKHAVCQVEKALQINNLRKIRWFWLFGLSNISTLSGRKIAVGDPALECGQWCARSAADENLLVAAPNRRDRCYRLIIGSRGVSSNRWTLSRTQTSTLV